MQTDAALRAEANELLAGALRDILATYGEVHVVGSYMMELMAWRDLDVHLLADPLDRQAFFDLGGRIAALLAPHRMHFRDETVARTPGLPAGLYWGVYLGDERQGAWKLDDVYEAVLDHGVTDLEGFRGWLDAREAAARRKHTNPTPKKYLHPLTAKELGHRFDMERAVAHGTIPSISFSDEPEEDLEAYAGTYLQHEVVAEGAVRNVQAFSRFLKVAALCNATIVNFTNVANERGHPWPPFTPP